MKLNLVRNLDGIVTSAYEISNEPNIINVKPVLKDGESEEIVEAPDDCFERFDELCKEWDKKKSAN